MTSKHYNHERCKREKFINKYLHGGGNVIDEFIIDRGHPMGAEIHTITDNGVIVIHNLESGKLITKLIARPSQIKRYYIGTGKKPSKKLLFICREHNVYNYNKI